LNARIDPIKQLKPIEIFSLWRIDTLARLMVVTQRMQNAALFFSLTGVRFCDIKKMRWNEIEFIEGRDIFLNSAEKD
jgi:integrase